MKIEIITLVDCPRCAKLKLDLSSNNIEFKNTNCEDDSNRCDLLENLLGIDEYPIILLLDNKDTLVEILYLSKSYNNINKTSVLEGGILGKSLYSIDTMIQYVKNKLN